MEGERGGGGREEDGRGEVGFESYLCLRLKRMGSKGGLHILKGGERVRCEGQGRGEAGGCLEAGVKGRECVLNEGAGMGR